MWKFFIYLAAVQLDEQLNISNKDGPSPTNL